MFILTSYGEAPQRRLRLLAGDSETNRVLGFPLRLQPELDQAAYGLGARDTASNTAIAVT